MNDLMEVGLTGSTQRTGKPATWPSSPYGYDVPRGSGQQWHDNARYKADTQMSGRQHD